MLILPNSQRNQQTLVILALRVERYSEGKTSEGVQILCLNFVTAQASTPKARALSSKAAVESNSEEAISVQNKGSKSKTELIMLFHS